jgi:hypothetical protein
MCERPAAEIVSVYLKHDHNHDLSVYLEHESMLQRAHKVCE